MLIGEYKHTIDSKRRLSLPAKMRKVLSTSVIVARGLEGCVFVYPMHEWEQMTKAISSNPTLKKDERDLSRFMYTGADNVDIDSLGRVLLPEHLCTYAGLAEQVVLVGVQNRIEIWDEKKWEIYRATLEQNPEQLVERIHKNENE